MVTGNRTRFYTKFNLSDVGLFPSKEQILLPFLATHVIISNDSDKQAVSFSFNGRDIDGELFKKETPITFDGCSDSRIWFFRDGVTNENVQMRVWAWRL